MSGTSSSLTLSIALHISSILSSVTGKLYFSSTFAARAALPSPSTLFKSAASMSAVYTLSFPAAASLILICSPTVTIFPVSVLFTSTPSSSIATISPVSILLQIAFILSRSACASSANSSPLLGFLSADAASLAYELAANSSIFPSDFVNVTACVSAAPDTVPFICAARFCCSSYAAAAFFCSLYASIFMNFLQKIMQGTLNSLHSLFYLSAFLFGCLAFLCGFENLNTAVP